MDTSAPPERYHALDATRAFALLLGVVFHAAWSFTGTVTGAPIADASGGPLFHWFFYTSHTFRMQLFFLIAGFFAHLVCHRRGFGDFVRNRLLRVGVPLLVGWFILFPLVVAAFVAGGNVSGRNLTELPLSEVFALLYQKGLMFVPRSAGGMLGLAHLWFLYYLILIYAAGLGLRYVLTRSDTVATRLRIWSDAGIRHVMQSRSGIPLLAIGTGLFLWPMAGWFGVDTPAWSLVPSLPVWACYGAFFAFGWCLHRQPHLLSALTKHWPRQLALGLALSIPLFAAFKELRGAGIGKSDSYPQLTADQVTNWPAFLARLQAAADPAAASTELAAVWSLLRPGERERIMAMTARSGPDARAGAVKAVAKLMHRPDMFGANADSAPPGDRAVLMNRVAIEQLFAGAVAGDPRKLAWYQPAKLVFSMGYGLVTWLLLFGTVGFFQARCSGHSPAWRYVADSSYWIYLAHLPLVAALQIWVAFRPWPGLSKFLFLNAVAFAILFVSYHYCVRSTIIGRILNGRTHPLAAWPFQRNRTANPMTGQTAMAPLAGGAETPAS